MFRISSLDYCALVGVSPYDTPVSLFLKKLHKTEEQREENFLMKLGKKFEQIHKELIKEYYNLDVVLNGYNIIEHPKYPQFIAVPDGFITENGKEYVIECKTCFHGYINYNFFETQLRWEMLVRQCDGLLSIVTPNDLFLEKYYRNEEWEKEAIEIAMHFIHLLEKGQLPEIDKFHKRTYEAIKNMKREPETFVELPKKYESIIKEIVELSKQKKELEEQIYLLKSQVMANMESEYGVCGDYKLRIVSYDRKPSITISDTGNKTLAEISELLKNVGVKFKINDKNLKVTRLNISGGGYEDEE